MNICIVANNLNNFIKHSLTVLQLLEGVLELGLAALVVHLDQVVELLQVLVLRGVAHTRDYNQPGKKKTSIEKNTRTRPKPLATTT